MDDARIGTLIDAGKNFKSLDVYTSAECIGKNQEFVRDGFEWDTWEKNMFRLHDSENIRSVHIMMTISALSIWSIAEFMNKIIDWRKNFLNQEEFFMSVNILRFPSFQSINIISQEVKNQLADEIEEALNRNKEYMIGWEENQFKRVIEYLRKVDTSYEDTDTFENKHHDFKTFVEQYAIRREMPIEDYMPKEFTSWFKTLKTIEKVENNG